MATRFRTGKPAFTAKIAVAAVTAVLVVVSLAGTAVAATSVTIPSGPFTSGQLITVTGSGFPSHAMDLTGLEILECADPGGLTSNLPTDPVSECDASTVSGNVINTDASGNFTDMYTILEDQVSTGGAINCDSTDFCVLWVGVDYNTEFLTGPHAFSTPFEVNAVIATTPEAPLAIALPSAAALVVGAYIVLRRRRDHARLPT